jgi:hypothetical protein
MAIKILDAGNQLMIDGDSRAEVQAKLEEHVARGSKIITATVAVGSRWVAACTIPLKSFDPDSTGTLSLSDVKAATERQADTPDVDDGCSVEEFGSKRFIRGPSERHVNMRIEHLKRFGAELVSEIERDGDSWVAIVDTGGDKSYRW